MTIKDKINIWLSRWGKVLNEQSALEEKGKELAVLIQEDLKHYYSRNGFHIKKEMFENLRKFVLHDEPKIRDIINEIFSGVIWFKRPSDNVWTQTSFFRERDFGNLWKEENNDIRPVRIVDIIFDIYRFYPSAVSFVIETYDHNTLGILVFSEMDMLIQKKFVMTFTSDVELQVSVDEPKGNNQFNSSNI